MFFFSGWKVLWQCMRMYATCYIYIAPTLNSLAYIETSATVQILRQIYRPLSSPKQLNLHPALLIHSHIIDFNAKIKTSYGVFVFSFLFIEFRQTFTLCVRVAAVFQLSIVPICSMKIFSPKLTKFSTSFNLSLHLYPLSLSTSHFDFSYLSILFTRVHLR